MTLAPGIKLGPYEILAFIGAGGMGQVYSAKDIRLGRTVAIKILNKEHVQRFEREARAIAALNHPHICSLYDVGPDYLVMEYVDGAAIKGPLPVEDAVRLAIQIAGALDEAHRNGILHRDLKPGNIMVTANGSAKLLDFGLAKLAAGADSETASTIEGTVMGTPAYMSPEQAQGKAVDARSDIFSFGAVLYEIVSGNRAFGGTSTAQVLSAVLRDEPKPLRTLPQLERIVMRCLSKQPGQRYQTMAEVKAALEQIAAKPAEQQPSIAVLPFTDMSPGKDNEWFSDGLAEEIINVLAHVPGLRVAGRTSSFFFRGKDVEFAEIGKKLNVENVLEGSVRKAGNRIRVTAQLIKVADGFHLWSERYDREIADVFAIQDEIASAIAEALKMKLSPELTGPRSYKPNLPAYEAYLKALHYLGKWNPESLERGRQYSEQAIELDPGFAPAHLLLSYYFVSNALGLGLLSAHEAMPKAREEARKALDIDPSLPEAHAMLGEVAGIYDYNWKEAERWFGQAMAHRPIPPMVRGSYGFNYLFWIGRVQEAINEIDLTLKEDPLNVLGRVTLARCFLAAGRPLDAETELRKILELDENHPAALAILSHCRASRGMHAEALALAEKAYSFIPGAPNVIGLLAGLLMLTGDTSRAEALLPKLGDGRTYGTPVGFAVFHLLCGEIDRVADWTEQAIEQRHPLVYAFFGMLRSSSRWPAIAKLMNLPEEAR